MGFNAVSKRHKIKNYKHEDKNMVFRLFIFAGILLTANTCLSRGDEPHWSYQNSSAWGDLSHSYSECKLGKHQSPVNIQTSQTQKANLSPIKVSYEPAVAEVLNNGHTIQVNLANAGSVTVPSGRYELQQFHFHTPSEEQVNGKSFPLVAHLVHQNKDGKLAVIAVLFNEGAENPAITPIFSIMPMREGRINMDAYFDATSLLPANLAYYQFSGSLTTPPCSEGVTWQVLMKPVSISSSQLKHFYKAYKLNARPIQPLNGRIIQSSN